MTLDLATRSALTAWRTARGDAPVVAARLTRAEERVAFVALTLGLTAREVRLCHTWQATGRWPSSRSALAHLTRFRRSNVAQDWERELGIARAVDHTTRARLGAASRALVVLVGLSEAARLARISPDAMRGLCRTGTRREGEHVSA